MDISTQSYFVIACSLVVLAALLHDMRRIEALEARLLKLESLLYSAL